MSTIARSYGLTMRSLIMAIVALLAMLIITLLTNCAGFALPASLPFEIGVRYQLEPGLYLVTTPKDKGGIDVKFEGQGQVNDHLSFDGIAWTYTSPRTGIIYRISEGSNRKPKIEIVGGGNGKLQLVPVAEIAKPSE